MVAITHAKSATLVPETRAEHVFTLFLDRLLGLVSGALDLVFRDDTTASMVLTRSALECFVDLYNLSRDEEKYLLVLRAMLLENRSALFHFKTEPFYGHFVESLGESGANRRGKEIGAQLKQALKEATDAYPLIRYSQRNLTVLNRFRIADMEQRYHTEYTWLSMETHNSLEPMIIEETMRRSGALFDEAQDDLDVSTVLHFSMGFMVDTLKCIDMMFGPDAALTLEFLQLLRETDKGHGGRS